MKFSIILLALTAVLTSALPLLQARDGTSGRDALLCKLFKHLGAVPHGCEKYIGARSLPATKKDTACPALSSLQPAEIISICRAHPKICEQHLKEFLATDTTTKEQGATDNNNLVPANPEVGNEKRQSHGDKTLCKLFKHLGAVPAGCEQYIGARDDTQEENGTRDTINKDNALSATSSSIIPICRAYPTLCAKWIKDELAAEMNNLKNTNITIATNTTKEEEEGPIAIGPEAVKEIEKRQSHGDKTPSQPPSDLQNILHCYSLSFHIPTPIPPKSENLLATTTTNTPSPVHPAFCPYYEHLSLPIPKECEEILLIDEATMGNLPTITTAEEENDKKIEKRQQSGADRFLCNFLDSIGFHAAAC